MMMKSRDLWLAFVLLFKIDALAPAVRSGFRHAAARGHGVALRAADVECDLVVLRRRALLRKSTRFRYYATPEERVESAFAGDRRWTREDARRLL